MSLAEAIANVTVGYVLAVLTQMLVFPPFGLRVALEETLIIGSIFTAVSIVRSYALRRLFETLRTRTPTRRAAAPAGGGQASVSRS